MGFEKGRAKTGGRTKGGKNRKSSRLIDQLKDHGFNFVKEFAQALKDLPLNATPVGTKYYELKSLLPYMAPRLREKEVELVDDPSAIPLAANKAAISDDELIKAMDNGTDKQPHPRRSHTNVVAKGNPELQTTTSPKDHIPDMVTE